MGAEIAPIQKPFAPDEIPATLRRIADDIEAGKHGLKTTCVVVLGHTERRPTGNGEMLYRDDFDVFGLGPRADAFTVRGLLLTAATQPIKGENNCSNAEPDEPA